MRSPRSSAQGPPFAVIVCLGGLQPPLGLWAYLDLLVDGVDFRGVHGAGRVAAARLQAFLQFKQSSGWSRSVYAL